MKKLLLTASLLLLTHGAVAQSAFQASVTPDIAIVPRDETVRGLALSIWGENQVNGVHLGFVNGHVGQSSGFSWSYIGSYAESYTGVIWGGFFAYTTGDVIGWQSGAVNISQGTLKGFQSGLVNWSEDVTGLQLGFVNYTNHLNGVQIGLANVVKSNEWFTDLPDDLAKGFPIVNWSF